MSLESALYKVANDSIVPRRSVLKGIGGAVLAATTIPGLTETAQAETDIKTQVTGYTVATNHPAYDVDGHLNDFYATVLGENGEHIEHASIKLDGDKYLLDIIIEAREPDGSPIPWVIWDLEEYGIGSPLISNSAPALYPGRDPPVAHLTVNPDDIDTGKINPDGTLIGKEYGIFAGGNLNQLYGTIVFEEPEVVPVSEFPTIAAPIAAILALFGLYNNKKDSSEPPKEL